MGCLLKTLEKGFIRLDKEPKKETTKKNTKSKKTNKNKKTNSDNKTKKEKNDNNNNKNKINNEQDIDNDDITIQPNKNNNNINNINKIVKKSNKLIKNKENYFKPEQLDYYTNVYLVKHAQIEPTIKLNFKK